MNRHTAKGGIGALAVVVLAMMALGTALLVWWHTRQTAAANDAPTLLVSGDTGGKLILSGCTANQSGGLARRGTHLAELRKKGNVIYVDAGGAAGGTTIYEKMKFEAILEGEKAMGIEAHNLGKSELALGVEYLRDLQWRLHVPFVCENVRDAEGKRIVEARRVVEAGGVRVAVLGVVSPRYARPGMRIEDPQDAVVEAASAMKGQCDVVVVLAYMPQDELEGFPRNLPGIDAVIGADCREAIGPKLMGERTLAAGSRKGDLLVELRVPAGRVEGAWEGKLVEMNSAIGDDPAQLENVKRYLSMLGEKDLSERQSELAVLPEIFSSNWRMAGSGACAKCHAKEHNSWMSSKHALSFATLQEKGFHVDSQCQRCHTSGYGIGGGFISAGQSGKSDLASVGCESCHGPSLDHAKDPRRQTSYIFPFDQCASCHDAEHSPNFKPAMYWGAMLHGNVSYENRRQKWTPGG